MQPYLSVIIPAYNEGERITRTLLDIDAYLSKKTFSYEIIVVNDGSRDTTAELVRNHEKVVKYSRLIDNKENKGKGAAVRQGMLEAKGEYCLFTDADNSTSIDQIERLLPFFREGYNVVIGSRAVKGSIIPVPQPWIRRVLGHIGNGIIQILVLPGIHDTQCGFKLFSAEAARDIFSRLTVYRWGFDIEALVIARVLHHNIKEVGITWVNDIHSHVSSSAYVQVLLETLRVRWNMWMKRYR
ncbi:MAG: glycosyltransferase family 2 protein [Patescibacteria group bacterium]|nr:glycosyltransferase family 2 protein [Patescibacteria group bacterium]MDE2437833.1 glycosyltransferase family 2 protein [Patescibacteria group bacterium]